MRRNEQIEIRLTNALDNTRDSEISKSNGHRYPPVMCIKGGRLERIWRGPSVTTGVRPHQGHCMMHRAGLPCEAARAIGRIVWIKQGIRMRFAYL